MLVALPFHTIFAYSKVKRFCSARIRQYFRIFLL